MSLEESVALIRSARFPEAEARLRGLVALEPGRAEALELLGVAISAQGRESESLPWFERALLARPGLASALHNRARALYGLGRLAEARADLEAALARAPDLAPAWTLLGRVLAALGDGSGAERCYRRALELRPDAAEPHFVLGAFLQGAGRIDEAIARLERAVALKPDFPEALMNLGSALAALARWDEAAARLEQAIAQRPAYADAYNNLGLLQQDRGDLEGAQAHYERALALDPGRADTLNNLGLLLDERGLREAAMGLYRRALEADPRLARAAYNLGIAHLHRFEFARGWELAEARYDTVPPMTPRRTLSMPQFTAEDWGRGRRVAIWREQGVGDQILHSTLLPELEARGQEFVVEVDARLAAAFERAHPRWTVAAPDRAAAAFAPCDRHLALGSLAGLLRPDLESFARQPRALLAADAARADAFRRRLGGDGRRIGISWRSFQGAVRGKVARGKSAPLAAFGALSRRPGVRLLDLQYGDTAAEREAFAASGGGLERLEGLDLFNDLDGVLAAIVACDLVVTTSNVTAHFAGALGKRTLLVYLNAASPFHYWVPAPGGRSLWYPSVEVVSGPRLDTWDKALAHVDELLAS